MRWHHKRLCRPHTRPRSRRYRHRTTTVPPGSTTKGLRQPVSAGDVIIQPTGTAHGQTNVKDYKSMAAFPEGVEGSGARDDGIKTIDLPALRTCTMAVPLPEDPVFGAEGSMRNSWTRAGDSFCAEGQFRNV